MTLTKKLSARIERHCQFFSAMATRLDVDMDRLVQAEIEMGGAYRRCLLCRNTRECADWLQGAAGAVGTPDFCPNARFFARSATAHAPFM
ncbi:DUF6455 family protein [Consotaella aegiceratis]|uniref:DUF6455 family protein n=1 Tax=Consotaella aegiceratis TaxID=3097961 RepID=UPI002F3F377E